MPAEKKDDRTEADNENTGSQGISCPLRRFPDQSPRDQLSALCREQNPAEPARVYSRERSSELAVRPVYCSSSPIQKRASDTRASPAVQAAAELPSKSDGYKAADLGETEPSPRWPAECCLT